MPQDDKLVQALLEIKEAINRLLEEKACVYIAIDGRCAAGKSTLAEALQRELGCEVAHMDDFFLRPGQRTAERLSKPGENVEYERFLAEVLIPYRSGVEFTYRPYDCHTQTLKKPVKVFPGQVFVVEGAYSCHDSLRDFYDLHIFLDVERKVQLERIAARNGAEAARRFEELWIPLEEAYFAAYNIKERCELQFKLG